MTSTQLRPSRRTLVRGAAWSVPVVSIAAAAPAFAASTCADGAYSVDWSNYDDSIDKVTAVRSGTSGTGTVGSSAMAVTVTSQFGGGMVAGSASDGASNLSKSPFNVGGTGAPGLTIMQRLPNGTNSLPAPRSSAFQTVTLAFTRAVWDLKFTITDIDSNSGQYQDRIFVSGSPAVTLSPQVQGAGSSTTPFSPTSNNTNHNPTTGNAGNVIVDYKDKPASSTYTITYWNDQAGNLSGNGLQGVFIAGLTFSSETC